MTKAYFARHLGTIFALTTLVACAGQETPIGLKTVNPISGEGDQLDAAQLHDQNLSSTLLDRVIQQGVPRAVAAQGFAKYDQFASKVKNKAYISLIDFTQFSGHPRFFMVNATNGHVDALMVAHGSGSDPQNSGTPTKFSNLPNSKLSSLGAYLVSELDYSTEHGKIARLDGLESTDSLLRPRAIILHSASYVSTSLPQMGRSWGCPAVSLDWIARVLQRLPGGSFMYAFGPHQSTMLDERLIQQIMTNPAYHWVDESLPTEPN
jgi:hypothetical protein